ncbi:LuxR C-terminal-related transcriptional regulator [Amycolatopsis sp. Poz14]|uniref:response regulator transcription factor n=1 Tax=Amycolatopsis sp. Poz14 TaxID=1447705 RepID=UPI00099D7B80|nr:LuxR C-terminal-related transcriptional regulator [Amycolatopsis sp. Poz14]
MNRPVSAADDCSRTPPPRRRPPREREVAVAVGQGSSNAEIARALGLSEATVKVHLGRIMAKTEAANRTQVAILVHDAGLA